MKRKTTTKPQKRKKTEPRDEKRKKKEKKENAHESKGHEGKGHEGKGNEGKGHEGSNDINNMTLNQILLATFAAKKTNKQIKRENARNQIPEKERTLTEEEEIALLEAEAEAEYDQQWGSQAPEPEISLDRPVTQTPEGDPGIGGPEITEEIEEYYDPRNEGLHLNDQVEGPVSEILPGTETVTAEDERGAADDVEWAPEPELGLDEEIDMGLGEEEANSIGPRVKLVNGKIVIDRDSLLVDKLDEEVEEFVKVHSSTGKRNTAYKKRSSNNWTEEETGLFYKVLQMCGTDFSLIQKLFPTRTRTQIKNKYKKEERDNPKILDWCYKNSIPLDVELFRERAGYTELGPSEKLEANSELTEDPAPQVKVEYSSSHTPGATESQGSTNPTDQLFEEDDEDDYNKPEYQEVNTEYYENEELHHEDKEEVYDQNYVGINDQKTGENVEVPDENKEDIPIKKEEGEEEGDEEFSFSLLK